MRIDWWTLVLQAVNFAILVWLLQRFLYKPVLRLIDRRRAEIDKQYQDAREAEAREKAAEAKAEASRAAIDAERSAILELARKEAERAAKARLARAEQEAAAAREAAQKTLAKERDEALAEAQRVALDLGAEMARRLIDEVPIALRAEAWLERIDRHLAQMAKPDLDALVRQAANGSALTVVTASPLPADTAAAWEARLRQKLGGVLPIVFAVDPKLIAGAELHFPNAILRLSWQDALASLRAEIVPHANAR